MKFCYLVRAIDVLRTMAAVMLSASFHFFLSSNTFAADTPEIRTPKPGPTPRINGPSIFGVRPDAPFLYRIPVTGERPMEFEIASLPASLRVDPKTGEITGSLKKAGEYTVTL